MLLKQIKLPLISIALLALQGCAAAIVGGALTTASSLHDPRSTGTQIDDQKIEIDVGIALSKDDALDDKANLNVISYNRVVLLTGQVQSDHLKGVAENIVRQNRNLRAVHNFVRTGDLAPLGTKTKDVWITSKVKAQLINAEDIDGLNIKVTTEDSEVFLMGLVAKEQADKAVEVARRVNGVSRVVKIFEYL